MADKTAIEWTDATWNPVRGCTRKSEGCRNCYAEVLAARFSYPGGWGEGFAEMRGGDHRWTGKVELIASKLDLPASWAKPRTIFVNSTSDLFHEHLSDADILLVLDRMMIANWHTYQVLTKRPDRARELLSRARVPCWICQGDGCNYCHEDGRQAWRSGPPPHVWIGTSVEDQATADERVPELMKTPAAVRFLSCEPLLGPVDLRRYIGMPIRDAIGCYEPELLVPAGRPDWVIAGSESGPGARGCDLDWVRSLRDQCTAASVRFFWKQHAERGRKIPTPELDGRRWTEMPDAA